MAPSPTIDKFEACVLWVLLVFTLLCGLFLIGLLVTALSSLAFGISIP